MTRNTKNPGIALLLTLLIVALLTGVVISFLRLSHIEALTTENLHAFMQAEILGRAGMKGAMTMLAMDDNKFDAQTDEWADFNRYAAMASGLFEEGGFQGKIEDLCARFNPNYIVNEKGLIDQARLEQFQRLLTILEMDPAVAPAVMDWLDPDDDIRPGGAEASFYATMENPYVAANGPFDSLGQMTLVKGLGPAAIYGREKQPGLFPYLTVHSMGRINLNTAGETVLMSLDDGLTREVAQEIMNARSEAPFEKLDDLKKIPGLTPQVLARITGRSAVAGTHFLITVEGLFREARTVVTAVVHRTDGGVRLIYYRTQ